MGNQLFDEYAPVRALPRGNIIYWVSWHIARPTRSVQSLVDQRDLRFKCPTDGSKYYEYPSPEFRDTPFLSVMHRSDVYCDESQLV
jgi:hypothetical protein